MCSLPPTATTQEEKAHSLYHEQLNQRLKRINQGIQSFLFSLFSLSLRFYLVMFGLLYPWFWFSALFVCFDVICVCSCSALLIFFLFFVFVLFF